MEVVSSVPGGTPPQCVTRSKRLTEGISPMPCWRTPVTLALLLPVVFLAQGAVTTDSASAALSTAARAGQAQHAGPAELTLVVGAKAVHIRPTTYCWGSSPRLCVDGKLPDCSVAGSMSLSVKARTLIGLRLPFAVSKVSLTFSSGGHRSRQYRKSRRFSYRVPGSGRLDVFAIAVNGDVMYSACLRIG